MTSYHPQRNGMIEHAHRTMKAALTARKESWLVALPIMLTGTRAEPNSSNTSAFFTVTGTNIMVPQLLVDDGNNNIDNQKFAK